MKRMILDIRKYLIEIKVGIFLLGAMIIIFIAAISIREMSFFKGSYGIKIKFAFAEGLRPASPLRFCGVDVGEVKKVKVEKKDGETSVYVYAKIEKGILIPKDSTFFINALSLFGEKYLEVVPVGTKNDGEFFKEGDEAVGISSAPLFNIMSSFHDTMIKLDDFIKEGEFKESLKDIVLNMKLASGYLQEVLRGVKEERGTVGRFIYDDSLYIKTEELIDELKAHPWKLLYKPKEVKKRER